jgi:hypothetical protein
MGFIMAAGPPLRRRSAVVENCTRPVVWGNYTGFCDVSGQPGVQMPVNSDRHLRARVFSAGPNLAPLVAGQGQLVFEVVVRWPPGRSPKAEVSPGWSSRSARPAGTCC